MWVQLRVANMAKAISFVGNTKIRRIRVS